MAEDEQPESRNYRGYIRFRKGLYKDYIGFTYGLYQDYIGFT